MLDPAIRAAWLASAAEGQPPDIALVARLEFGLYVNWHIDESIFLVGRDFLKDPDRISLECMEMSRGAGKSLATNALRLWLAEYVLPFAKDRYGNPIRPEQRVMVLVGRNEDDLRDRIFWELKDFIITYAPWLRSDDWLEIIGDPKNPDPHGIRALANMPSKGTQKWEAYRLDLANGITFLGRSIKQGVRGYHPLYIDADDLLEEKNAHESADIYELLMSAHVKALESGGLFLMLGTPQDPSDIYSIAQNASRPSEDGRRPMWTHRQYPAYDEDGTLGFAAKNKALLDSLGDKRHFANLPVLDRPCLWPSRMSWSFLEQDRGTTLADNERFQRERMLKRITVSSALVHPDYIELAKDPTLSYHDRAESGHHYYLGHDPSSLKKDNAAWCVGYFDTDKNLVPADFTVLNADPHLQEGQGEIAVVQELNSICRRFSYPDGVVESNGFQGILTVVGRMLDPSMLSRFKKFQLGRNKHTEAGWLGVRTIFRMRKVRLPYKTERDRATTDAFLHELRGLQYKGGEVLEDPGRKNDRVSAFFLMLKATELHEAIISASVLPLPGHSAPSPNSPKSYPPGAEHREFNSNPNRPTPGSLSDMRARLAKWSSMRNRLRP